MATKGDGQGRGDTEIGTDEKNTWCCGCFEDLALGRSIG